jgi:hypothetical protein
MLKFLPSMGTFLQSRCLGFAERCDARDVSGAQNIDALDEQSGSDDVEQKPTSYL